MSSRDEDDGEEEGGGGVENSPAMLNVLQQENERVKKHLTGLQDELGRLQNTVKTLLSFRHQAEELRVEKEALHEAYKSKLQQYQATISTLEEENDRLRDATLTREDKNQEKECSKLKKEIEDLQRQNTTLSSLVLTSSSHLLPHDSLHQHYYTGPRYHHPRHQLQYHQQQFLSLPTTLCRPVQVEGDSWPGSSMVASWHVDDSGRGNLSALTSSSLDIHRHQHPSAVHPSPAHSRPPSFHPCSQHSQPHPECGQCRVSRRGANNTTCWYDIIKSLHQPVGVHGAERGFVDGKGGQQQPPQVSAGSGAPLPPQGNTASGNNLVFTSGAEEKCCESTAAQSSYQVLLSKCQQQPPAPTTTFSGAVALSQSPASFSANSETGSPKFSPLSLASISSSSSPTSAASGSSSPSHIMASNNHLLLSPSALVVCSAVDGQASSVSSEQVNDSKSDNKCVDGTTYIQYKEMSDTGSDTKCTNNNLQSIVSPTKATTPLKLNISSNTVFVNMVSVECDQGKDAILKKDPLKGIIKSPSTATATSAATNSTQNGTAENNLSGEGGTKDEGYSTMSSDVQAEGKDDVSTCSGSTVKQADLSESVSSVIAKDNREDKDICSDKRNSGDGLEWKGDDVVETNGADRTSPVCEQYCDGLRVIDDDDNNSDIFFIPIREVDDSEEKNYRHSYHMPGSCAKNSLLYRCSSDSQLMIMHYRELVVKNSAALEKRTDPVASKGLPEKSASTLDVRNREGTSLEEDRTGSNLRRTIGQASLKRRKKVQADDSEAELANVLGSDDDVWDDQDGVAEHTRILSPTYSHAEMEDWSLDLSNEDLSRIQECSEADKSVASESGQGQEGSLPSIQETTLELEEDHSEFLWNGATYLKPDVEALNWPYKTDQLKNWQCKVENARQHQSMWSPKSGCSDQPAIWSSNEQLSCCSEGLSKCSSDLENFYDQICSLAELKRVSFCSSENSSQEPSKGSAKVSDTGSIGDHCEFGEEPTIDTDFTRDFYRLVKFESSKSLAASSKSLAPSDGLLTIEKIQNLESKEVREETLASVLHFIVEQQKYCTDREEQDEKTRAPNPREEMVKAVNVMMNSGSSDCSVILNTKGPCGEEDRRLGGEKGTEELRTTSLSGTPVKEGPPVPPKPKKSLSFHHNFVTEEIRSSVLPTQPSLVSPPPPPVPTRTSSCAGSEVSTKVLVPCISQQTSSLHDQQSCMGIPPGPTLRPLPPHPSHRNSFCAPERSSSLDGGGQGTSSSAYPCVPERTSSTLPPQQAPPPVPQHGRPPNWVKDSPPIPPSWVCKDNPSNWNSEDTPPIPPSWAQGPPTVPHHGCVVLANHYSSPTESPPVPKRITSRRLPMPPVQEIPSSVIRNPMPTPPRVSSLGSPLVKRPRSLHREVANLQQIGEREYDLPELPALAKSPSSLMAELQRMAKEEEEEERRGKDGEHLRSPTGEDAGCMTGWIRVNTDIDLRDPQTRANLLDGMMESSEGCSSETDEDALNHPYAQLHSIHRQRRRRKASHRSSSGGMAVVRGTSGVSGARPSIIGRQELFLRFGHQEEEALNEFGFLNEFSTSHSDLGSQEMPGSVVGMTNKSNPVEPRAWVRHGEKGSVASPRTSAIIVPESTINPSLITSFQNKQQQIKQQREQQSDNCNNRPKNQDDQRELDGMRGRNKGEGVDTSRLRDVKSVIKQLNNQGCPSSYQQTNSSFSSSTSLQPANTSVKQMGMGRGRAGGRLVACEVGKGIIAPRESGPTSNTSSKKTSTSACRQQTLSVPDSRIPTTINPTLNNNINNSRNSGGSSSPVSKTNSPTRIPRILGSPKLGNKSSNNSSKEAKAGRKDVSPSSALPPRSSSTKLNIKKELGRFSPKTSPCRTPLRSPKISRLKKGGEKQHHQDPLDAFSNRPLCDSGGSSEGSERFGGRLSLSDSCAENFSPMDSGDEVFQKG